MAWTKGFNFRNTSGYVTDTGNNTYVLHQSTLYPTTRNSVTFGWESSLGMDGRDRNNTVDERFAGSNFNNTPYDYKYFRVDLPSAGDYAIRLSMGDYSYTQVVEFAILDNATVLTSKSGATVAANRYMDAGGTVRTSPSDWISNNAAFTGTFSSTILKLRVGDGGSSINGGSVTHLWIDQVSAAGGIPKTTKLTLLGVG